MADATDKRLSYSAARIEKLLAQLTEMASQTDTSTPLPISPARDELDAVAYAVNALLGELRFANDAKAQLEARRAKELRVAKDAADAANRAKSIFLSNISHELRTPVSLMVASAELIAKKKLDTEESARLAERFLHGAHVLVGLLDNVLDWAKIESGLIDVREAAFWPETLLREAHLSFLPSAEGKRLALLYDDHEPLPPLMGDVQRIRQIVFNLLSNAIKYTSAGRVTLSARLQDTGAGHALHLAVTDTGRGISADDRACLFLPFGRVADSFAVAGTGLGLHISSRLAAALGGSLDLAWSEPGQGSRFELCLPVKLAYGDPQAARPAGLQSLRGVRVLLADDHADIREFFGDLLTLEGAQVMTAPDGEAAVAMALANDFDILLLDVQMPFKTGLEAIATLRAAGYAKPALALTANATRDHREHCLAHGFSGYIAKPVDLDTFVEVIVRYTALAAPNGTIHR